MKGLPSYMNTFSSSVFGCFECVMKRAPRTHFRPDKVRAAGDPSRYIVSQSVSHGAVKSSLIAPLKRGGRVSAPGGAAGCSGSRAAGRAAGE